MAEVINTWGDIGNTLDTLRDGTTDQTTFAHLYQKLTLGRLPLPPEFSIRDAQKILYFLLVHQKDIENFFCNVHSKGLGLGEDDLVFWEDIKNRANCGITIDVPNENSVQAPKSSKSIVILSKDDPHTKKPRKKESLSSVVKKISLGKIEYQSEEFGNTTPDQSDNTPQKYQKKRSGSVVSPRSSVESETSKSRSSSIGSKLKSVTIKTSGRRKIRNSIDSLSENENLSSGEIPEIGSPETENSLYNPPPMSPTTKKKFQHNLVDRGSSVQGHCRVCNEEVPHLKQKTLCCTICSILVHSSCVEMALKQKCKEQDQSTTPTPNKHNLHILSTKHKIRMKRQEPVNPKRPPIGHIQLTLVEAKDLAKADFGGKSDPYAVVTSNVSSERFKTKWIRQTLFPVWNEIFNFAIHAAEGELTITVWDFDFGKPDDFLGMFNLSIPQIISNSENGPIDEWYQFQVERKKSKKKPKGMVHLKITYIPVSTETKQPRPKVGSFFNTPENIIPVHEEKERNNNINIPVQEETPKEVLGEEGVKRVVEGGEVPVRSAVMDSVIEDERHELGKIISISEFNELYTLGDTLGKGATSIVRQGVKINTQEKVAVKVINKLDEMWSNAAVDELRREVLLISLLSHRHVTGWKDILETEDNIFIILEFVDGGDLLGALLDSEEGFFSEEKTARICKQVLSGLQYIHKNNIVHRDIKPENILVTQKGVYKISDFGESAQLTQERPLLNEYRGTQLYMAPEVLKGQDYGTAVDMWSLGCVTYCMLCGYPPFENPDDETLAFTILNILEHKLEFPEQEWLDISPDAMKFVKSLLNPVVDARVTAKQAMKHPWLLNLMGGGKGKKHSKADVHRKEIVD